MNCSGMLGSSLHIGDDKSWNLTMSRQLNALLSIKINDDKTKEIAIGAYADPSTITNDGLTYSLIIS